MNFIHKYYVDPKTKFPHPVVRIENALVDLKYRVDADLSVDKQVQEIMRNMPGVLPVQRCAFSAALKESLFCQR